MCRCYGGGHANDRIELGRGAGGWGDGGGRSMFADALAGGMQTKELSLEEGPGEEKVEAGKQLQSLSILLLVMQTKRDKLLESIQRTVQFQFE